VLDRASSTAQYPGVEYGLQARAMHALNRAGADGAARRRGHPVRRFEFYTGDRRQLALRVDPEWTVGVLRREFLADLAALVEGPVLRGHDVTSVSGTDDGRAVTVTFAGGQPARTFDLLIAADGVHSVARRTFFPDDAGTHDRGFSIVYLLVDASGVPDAAVPPGFLDVANGPVIRFTRGSCASSVWFPAGRGRLTLALGLDHPTRARLWPEHVPGADASWQDLPGPVREALTRRVAADVPGPDGLIPAALDLVQDWTSPDVYQWSMRDSDPLPRPYASTRLSSCSAMPRTPSSPPSAWARAWRSRTRRCWPASSAAGSPAAGIAVETACGSACSSPSRSNARRCGTT
jgi:2-polyprenyl-6-methoxyphenol hydroxylase-like FAD-dependent oxidoreductase